MNLYLDPPSDGPTNMARDLALLNDAEEGRAGARVYSWLGRWVTLGRFQTPDEALQEFVPYVVRPTGGGAVLHGHDVTVTVAIPHDRHARSVRDDYKSLVGPLVEALNACGLSAKLAEETGFAGKGKRGGDCFAFSSPNDVVDPDTGQKVCGCALRITDRGALLQASIPRTTPSRLASELLKDGVDLPVRSWEEDRFREEFRLALSRGFGDVEAIERMTTFERKLT